MTAAATAQTSAIARMHAAWQLQANGQPLPSWTILDTGFGGGNTFLSLWQGWRAHASPPALLHYVGVLCAAQAAQLPALLRAAGATALANLCHDLEAGFHRLLLEDGQLSLTLCVGETGAVLDRQQMQADTVLLASPDQPWDKWQLKALARCCKRGAQLQFCGPLLPEPGLLADAGLVVSGTDSTTGPTQAEYAPRWQLRSERTPGISIAAAGRCAVIGAGIAGASVARTLALRGLEVDVYDAQDQAAGGASGLPLGLVVPHHSADDSPRSRMSRSGTRLMLQHASRCLQAGQDWQPGGVLELRIAEAGLAEAEVLSRPAPAPGATGWAQPMAYGNARGLWHAHAAWIKPALLVQRWLDHPRIRFYGKAAVHSLERVQGPQIHWLLRNAQGLELGRAAHVVFANAHGCVELALRLAEHLGSEPACGFTWVADALGKLQAMQRMFGTLSYGPSPAAGADGGMDLPAFPVNGHGSFASGIPTAQGPRWYAGATFQSEGSLHAKLAEEHAANFCKLQALLPAAAQALAPQFSGHQVQAWQGSRCISHDRLPLVGPLEDATQPTLWLCAGMGARGLSFSALCAELLAAQLCGEPLPLESNLARSLDTRRPRRARAVTPA